MVKEWTKQKIYEKGIDETKPILYYMMDHHMQMVIFI